MAIEFGADGAGALANASGLCPQPRIADHFLDIAQAVGPFTEIFAGERTAIGALLLEEAIAFFTGAHAVSTSIAAGAKPAAAGLGWIRSFGRLAAFARLLTLAAALTLGALAGLLTFTRLLPLTCVLVAYAPIVRDAGNR